MAALTVLTREPEAAARDSAEAPPGVCGLVELILKDPASLERRLRDPDRPLDLVPRLLFIALFCTTLFGIAISALLLASPATPPYLPEVRLADGSALAPVLAYDLGLIAACGVCLPSFYFYGLLAGIRASMLQVTVHALKGLAVSGVALVGLLPVYVAFELGLVVFGASQEAVAQALFVGLFLPFIAGLIGMRSLYRGFLGLTDTLPPERRCRRRCFLRRLVTAWAGVYTAVTPVMIYTLWQKLASQLAS